MPNAVPVGSSMVKNRNSTPKAKKPRSTARYVRVEIRLTRAEYDRGLAYFEEEKFLGRFLLDAYREKLNRAEANDKAGRLRILSGNIALLEPVLKEMYSQGKLDFLKEQSDG
jgi:hypothetical protein